MAGSSPGSSLDYSFWTGEDFKRLPPHIALYHDPMREISWLWRHGFRVRDTRMSPVKPLWMCAPCSYRREAKMEKYIIVANYTQVIEVHLLRKHGIKCTPGQKKYGGKPLACSSAPEEPSVRTTRNSVKAQVSKSPKPDEDQAAPAATSIPPSQWDEKQNRVLLLDWITHHNLPFSVVQSKQFSRLLLYNNPSLRADQIPSAETLIRALDGEYNRALVSVREVLQNARSRIHYTFEGWKPRQGTSTSLFLGVNAHFIDNQWRQWKILLALPAQIGRHVGDALADEVAATLNSFEISNSIGYFTLDNASGNGATVEALGREFEFNSSERRIRCAPHFLNHVAKIMMYGHDGFDQFITKWKSDSDEHDERRFQDLVDTLDGLSSLEDADQQSHGHESEDTEDEDIMYPIHSELTTEEMNKHRKSGPFGKLHNIGVHMRQSSQIREAFIEAQRQTNGSDEAVLEFLPNNSPSMRWQFDEGMAARALSRRRALNRMFANIEESWLSQGGRPEDKPSVLDERLSPNEWQAVFILRKILQLFKIASKQLQGDGVSVGASRGSFDDYFPVIEMLLDHLDTANEGHIIEEDENNNLVEKPLFDSISREARQVLRIYIKLGWKKLKAYCSKLTPAAYVGAVVFHPCKKWAGIEELGDQLPARRTANWEKEYQKSLVSIWESDCTNMLTLDDEDEPRRNSVSNIIGRRLAYSRANPVPGGVQTSPNVSRRQTRATRVSAHSELDEYLSQPPVNIAAYEENPIGWWREVGSKKFPKLSYMAVDYLTIPSSSTEAGKGFSNRMIAPAGTRLRRHVMGMAQCLRSWSKAGIYQPTLPLGMLEGDNWQEVLRLVGKN